MGNTYSRSSGDVLKLKTETLAAKHCSFLDLPPEVRLAIYHQTLLIGKPLQWRGPYPSSDHAMGSLLAGFLPKWLAAREECPAAITQREENSNFSTSTMSLLFTCRTVYHEAIELFYRNNIFMIWASTIGLRPFLRHQPLLLLVQRLRIECKAYNRSLDFDDYLDQVDAATSTCLRDVTECCPTLKSLTIYGIIDSQQMDWYVYRFLSDDDGPYH